MSGYGIKGTFRMLRAMSTEHWMGAREIAKASNSPLVTTYSRLNSLISVGVVERSEMRFKDGSHQRRKSRFYRRTIIFMGERRKV